MSRSDLADYTASVEPDLDYFRAWFELADSLGATVGLTREGNLMMTLPAGSDRADHVAERVNTTPSPIFTYAYVVAGCDTTLEPDL